MSDSFIIAAAVLDNVILLVIFGWVFLRSRKLRQLTHWTIIIAGLLLILNLFVGAVFPLCLERPQREKFSKYFPDGTHVFAAIVMLGLYELVYLGYNVCKRLTTRKGN